MALDEALLRSVSQPVLRVYRWREKTVSIGCFGSWSEARSAFGSEWAVVRRWTGGGVVPHDGDWTYSLVVPAGVPLGESSTVASYRVIHRALATALAGGGINAELAPEAPASLGGLCFAAAVTADVLVGGKKVAGAAQRRTRFGLLHQGSLQGVTVPAGTAEALAAHLGCPAPSLYTPRAQLLAEAETLRAERYATPAWLHRIV